MVYCASTVGFLFLVTLLGLCPGVPLPDAQSLLVVSFDGFRPDYLNRNVTPNLNKFRSEGTFVRYMRPVFPTKTFTNHFTIATGLYADKHGVLANKLYDQKYEKLLRYSYEMFHYNDSVIPIWTANEISGRGRHSGCMWPGGDFDYQGVNCTFKRSYDPSIPFEKRVDEAMDWLTNKTTPANLVMLYMEESDRHSHMFGPESMEVTKKAEVADNLANYIEQKLKENNLERRVNIIYLSDHGMSDVSLKNAINLTKFLNEGSCHMFGKSPVLQIVPKNAILEKEIFVNLTKAATRNGHFKVYNNENLPRRWHANNSRRLGPILAVADDGYAFQDLWAEAEKYQRNNNVTIIWNHTYGVHGYDNMNSNMQATFMAKGPLFSKGKVLESINMVDLYNLFCKILDINCGPTDGTDVYSDILKGN